MKILFLSAAVSIHTVRWVNSLVSRGHEVHLVYNKDHKPKGDQISSEVIMHPLRFTGSKAYYLNALELKKIYKNVKPHIVNAHYASGYGTLARMARVKPLLLSVWGSDVYDFPYQSDMKMKIITRNLLYANKIASTSHCMAKVTQKLVAPIKLDITVTPFGVDVERFSRQNNYLEKDTIIIGNIKMLKPKYGITDLIKAVKTLKDDLIHENMEDLSNKIIVKIYGDGDQKEELIGLTLDLKLEDSIKFMGRIPNDEVPKALEEFDIFCATSVLDSESFGVAIVEAMTMSVPVIATNVDGFKEVVEDGITGYIVERNNPKAIANGLKKLVIDEDLRKELGKQGRARVIKNYDWEKNVTTMENIYKELNKN